MKKLALLSMLCTSFFVHPMETKKNENNEKSIVQEMVTQNKEVPKKKYFVLAGTCEKT